jgi:hypothetical protein
MAQEGSQRLRQRPLIHAHLCIPSRGDKIENRRFSNFAPSPDNQGSQFLTKNVTILGSDVRRKKARVSAVVQCPSLTLLAMLCVIGGNEPVLSGPKQRPLITIPSCAQQTTAMVLYDDSRHNNCIFISELSPQRANEAV